ncbi:MAG: DMT family transporter [Clostridia bacterium]|nr:DMT family transporter [Clostridia bacterium]
MIFGENFFKKPIVVCLGAILCCVLWGSAFPCVKIGYSLFNVNTGHVPSVILFAGLRFTLAGVMVLIFAGAAQRKIPLPKKQNVWRILVLCLFQTIGQYVFFYIGLANTTGVKSAVLNGLGVFFTILSACFIFRTEKFNLIKLLGCILGFGGVILINLGGDFSFTFTLQGEGAIILSGISSAIAAGFVKIFSKHENTSTLCGWQFFIGGSVLIIVGLSFGGTVDPQSALSFLMLLYLAFISSFAFTLQGYLVKYNPISKVAVFKSTNPLFGAIFSAIILLESEQLFSYFTLLALILVCAGIFVINKFGEKDFFIKKK